MPPNSERLKMLSPVKIGTAQQIPFTDKFIIDRAELVLYQRLVNTVNSYDRRLCNTDPKVALVLENLTMIMREGNYQDPHSLREQLKNM